MKTAIILAAGNGRRLWPYSVVRPKVMVPVANKPLIDYNITTLKKLGFKRILIASGEDDNQIRNYYMNDKNIEVVCAQAEGTAFSLDIVSKLIKEERFAVVYGDTIIHKEDLQYFIKEGKSKGIYALTDNVTDEEASGFIACSYSKDHIDNIEGRPRGIGCTKFSGAFILDRSFMKYIKNNSGLFTKLSVGNMPKKEGYLEMSLWDYIKSGGIITGVKAKHKVIDIDKPWHLLSANSYMCKRLCQDLNENIIDETAFVSNTAKINGYVSLGKNSRIGHNVIIEGNVIVGDNTVIDNGALFKGACIVGDNTVLSDYCYIADGSVIGNRAKVLHCAELFGTIFDGVYLYHYMEMSGIIGENTDIGGATVCGTLRFDNGVKTHVINGRREKPLCQAANDVYIGDFCRTGVNSILMPGIKMGPYSVAGPGAIIDKDIPDRTMVLVKQDHEYKKWGPEKYGW